MQNAGVIGGTTMPKRVELTVPATLPEEMLDQLAPAKSLKFYPRFLYLLDQLAAKWKEAGLIAEGNRSEAMRLALDEYTRQSSAPLPWLKARPRYARPTARVAEDQLVRGSRQTELADPQVDRIEGIPWKPYVTFRQAQQVDKFVAQYDSSWTYVLYQAIWDAAIRHGLQPVDAPIDLRAPEDWSRGK